MIVYIKLILERSLRNECDVSTAPMGFDHALVARDLIKILVERSGCRWEGRERRRGGWDGKGRGSKRERKGGRDGVE